MVSHVITPKAEIVSYFKFFNWPYYPVKMLALSLSFLLEKSRFFMCILCKSKKWNKSGLQENFLIIEAE